VDIGFRRPGFAPQDSYFWAKNEHEVISCELEATIVQTLATATADRELQATHQAAITAQATAAALGQNKSSGAITAAGVDPFLLTTCIEVYCGFVKCHGFLSTGVQAIHAISQDMFKITVD
jgi:hypothetical protein